MAVTEVKEVHQAGWAERTGNSFKGVISGLVMFVGAIGLLFWNEGRAVKTARRLAEGAGAVVSVSADRVDSANEGKLVHVGGKAVTQDMLKDDAFGVAVNAIRLEREVEIFQWVEHSESRTVKKGDKTFEETTYTYSQEWCSKPVDSSGFKEVGHGNPPAAMLFNDETKLASEVRLGAFRLSGDNIKQIGGAKDYVFPQNYAVPASIKGGQLVNGRIYVPFTYGATPASLVNGVVAAVANAGSPLAGGAAPAAAAPKGSPLAGGAAPAAAAPKGSPLAGGAAPAAAAPKGSPLAGGAAPAAAAPKGSPLAGSSSSGGAIAAAVAQSAANAAVNAMGGRNPAQSPVPGDLRIRFRVVEPHDITIIEKQTGDSFAPWRASDKKTLSFVRDGLVDAETIFENAKSGNNMMTLILRVFGFLLMFWGFKAVLGPISTIVDAIPVLNGIVAAGVGLVAFLVAGAVSLLTIGVAWIFYRPVVGVALIVVAGVLIALVFMKRKKVVAAA